MVGLRWVELVERWVARRWTRRGRGWTLVVEVARRRDDDEVV